MTLRDLALRPVLCEATLMQAVPPLQAPVWERQPSETEAEHAAFVAWACGPRAPEDWTSASSSSGLDGAEVRAASVRWAWRVRAQEWHRHSRELAREAASDVRQAVKDLTLVRVAYAQRLAQLVAHEAGKHLALAQGTGAVTLSPRDLARMAAVADSVLTELRKQSEGLPSEAGATSLDWGRLTPAELEQARKLRAKAEGRSA